MAKAAKKKATRARRPRYIPTDVLAKAIGERPLDDLSELAEMLKEGFPWGASFLAARLKAPAKVALPPDVPEQGEDAMPETVVNISHTSRMDAINAAVEAGDE